MLTVTLKFTCAPVLNSAAGSPTCIVQAPRTSVVDKTRVLRPLLVITVPPHWIVETSTARWVLVETVAETIAPATENDVLHMTSLGYASRAKNWSRVGASWPGLDKAGVFDPDGGVVVAGGRITAWIVVVVAIDVDVVDEVELVDVDEVERGGGGEPEGRGEVAGAGRSWPAECR